MLILAAVGGARRTSALGVRRDKAALSSGCKAHPALRSSRKQSEQSWTGKYWSIPPRLLCESINPTMRGIFSKIKPVTFRGLQKIRHNEVYAAKIEIAIGRRHTRCRKPI